MSDPISNIDREALKKIVSNLQSPEEIAAFKKDPEDYLKKKSFSIPEGASISLVDYSNRQVSTNRKASANDSWSFCVSLGAGLCVSIGYNS